MIQLVVQIEMLILIKDIHFNSVIVTHGRGLNYAGVENTKPNMAYVWIWKRNVTDYSDKII